MCEFLLVGLVRCLLSEIGVGGCCFCFGFDLGCLFLGGFAEMLSWFVGV